MLRVFGVWVLWQLGCGLVAVVGVREVANII